MGNFTYFLVSVIACCHCSVVQLIWSMLMLWHTLFGVTLLLLLFYFPFSYVFIVCIVVNDVRTPVFAVK